MKQRAPQSEDSKEPSSSVQAAAVVKRKARCADKPKRPPLKRAFGEEGCRDEAESPVKEVIDLESDKENTLQKADKSSPHGSSKDCKGRTQLQNGNTAVRFFSAKAFLAQHPNQA